ncbi:MAG: hypothetical protein ACE5GK_04730 [Nitrospiria bacterium]
MSLPTGIKVVEGEDPMKALQKLPNNPSRPREGMADHPSGIQDPKDMMEQLKKMQEMIQEQMKNPGGQP